MSRIRSWLSGLSRREIITVSFLLILGAMLRFVALSDNPPGIFRDELEKGYTALQLWETGRHGILGAEGIRASRFLPIFIEVFDGHDRTSAIYQYVAAPFVGIFGLNVYTTRFPAAFAGFGCLILLWLLARRWFGSFPAACALSAMVVHPAHIIFSRWAQQGIFSLLFLLAGLLTLEYLRSVSAKHRRSLAIVGGGLFFLAAYSYDPARLVVPLVLGARLLLMSRESRGFGAKWLVGAFVLPMVPLFVYTLTAGSARLQRVGVFEDGLLGAIPTVLQNYFTFFTFDFWCWSGDSNPRHSLPINGFAPIGLFIYTFYAGLLLLIFRKAPDGSPRLPLFLLAWLLLAPAAAALTRDGLPHALRGNLLIPVLPLLLGLMISQIIRLPRVYDHRPKRQRVLVAGIFVPLVFAFLADGTKAAYGLILQKNQPPYAWESGVQDLMQKALAQSDSVNLSAEIPYAPYVALFAEKTSPANWQEDGLDALRTRIIPPGQSLWELPGVTIGLPMAGYTLEFQSEYVLMYQVTAEGLLATRRDGATEILER